jgi:hypothetical protein
MVARSLLIVAIGAVAASAGNTIPEVSVLPIPLPNYW